MLFPHHPRIFFGKVVLENDNDSAYDRLRFAEYSAATDARFGLQTLSNLLPVTATFASGQKSHQFGRGKLDKYIFAHMSANAHCNLLWNRIEIVMSNKP